MRSKILTGCAANASICSMAKSPIDKPLPVRITPEQVRRIDQLRGLVSRERYVREVLLEPAITREERKAAKS